MGKTMSSKLAARVLAAVLFLLFFSHFVYAQQTEAARRSIIRFGTETEITALIQSLRADGADYLDDELIELAETTRNQRILTGIFNFFGEREQSGLEDRAIRIIEERDDEANETVHSAVDYLGWLRVARAVPVLKELLDTQERRFMNTAFRAIGRAASADEQYADEVAQFLVDFYSYRDPGEENQREVIIAIGATGSSKGVPLLAQIAANSDERIPLRMAALDALARIGDPDGLDAIIAGVNSANPNVRIAAVGALGPFYGQAVDNAILEAFRDANYRTRIAASRASRDRRLQAAVPYLRFRAERDEVPGVRDEAIRALGAIGGDEALYAIETFFSERRNPDRIRLLSAEMLMRNNACRYFPRLVEEMDYAQSRHQTNLFNGFLRLVGEATIASQSYETMAVLEHVTRRFMQSTNVIERLHALDMAANNNLAGFESEIKTLAADRNESIARRAKRAAERLGIEI